MHNEGRCSIIEHYEKLRPKEWDYYLSNSFDERNHISNPFLTDKSEHSDHLKFIDQYFKNSEKERALKLFNFNNYKFSKGEHSNSVFFLGLVINKYCFGDLLFDIFKREDGNKNEFIFLWFLICLYHDIAMEIENSGEKNEKIIDVDNLYTNLEIKYKLLDQRSGNINQHIFESIRNYFLMRRIVEGKIDHGIYAAVLLFDRLVKNRKRLKRIKATKLHVGDDLDKTYAIAASAIGVHNIWYPNKDNVRDYAQFELTDLINAKPIKFKDDPMLFLLGIVDTLDPIKIYKNKFSTKDILKNILLELKPRYIKFLTKKGSSMDINDLIYKSKNLNGWLDLKLKTDNVSLTIEFY